jgi:hypothetical protein
MKVLVVVNDAVVVVLEAIVRVTFWYTAAGVDLRRVSIVLKVSSECY